MNADLASESKGRLSLADMLALARLPFHSVGILPFLVGISLAWSKGYPINLTVAILGLAAVDLIMLATYLLGEVFDYEGDLINKDYNRFSGGSRVPFSTNVSLKGVLLAGWASALTAVAIGLVLQLVYGVGALALPLGLVGVLCGTFYSAKPFRWVSRGFGELLIAFCYGWLPVNVGYYLFSGSLSIESTMVSIPLAMAIFNVIAINEFPDYRADIASDKRNLTVRLGKRRVAEIYSAVAILAVLFAALTLLHGISPAGATLPLPGALICPVFALASLISFENAVDALRKRYTNEILLERVCMKTVVVHLLFSVMYIVAFVADRTLGA